MWFKFPYYVLNDENLTMNAKVLYGVLADKSKNRGWQISINISELAQILQITPRTIITAIKQLQEYGYIVSKKSDGRKLIIEIKPLRDEGKEKSQSKPTSEQERSRGGLTQEQENILLKKLIIKLNDTFKAGEVLKELKEKAKNAQIPFAYISKSIDNYQEKPSSGRSSGFDADKYKVVEDWLHEKEENPYEMFWNKFDD